MGVDGVLWVDLEAVALDIGLSALDLKEGLLGCAGTSSAVVVAQGRKQLGLFFVFLDAPEHFFILH